MDRRTLIQAGTAIAALPSLSFSQSLTTVNIQIDGAAVPFTHRCMWRWKRHLQ